MVVGINCCGSRMIRRENTPPTSGAEVVTTDVEHMYALRCQPLGLLTLRILVSNETSEIAGD